MLVPRDTRDPLDTALACGLENQNNLELVNVENQSRDEGSANGPPGQHQQANDDLTRIRLELEAVHRQIAELRRMMEERQPREQHIQQQNVVPPAGQNNVSSTQVAEIVGAISNNQIDKLPKFEDENKLNSLEFIELLNKYFLNKNIKENRKLSVVEIALEGRARLWLHSILLITNYYQFVENFTNNFILFLSKLR